MATRQRQAQAAAEKAERLEALEKIEGKRLPLPTDPRDEPADLTDPELPAEIISLGANGLSDAQIANHLAVTADELRDAKEAHPALKHALSRARTAAIAWWEEKARHAVVTNNNRFPAGAWSHIMRAQFPEYADHSGVTVNLDLSRFVVIHRREPGVLTGSQSPDGANRLESLTTVRLAPSLTPSEALSGEVVSGAGPEAADPTGQGSPEREGGGGGKPGG